MDYLPIFAKLEGLPCLVVGGGEVAWRKIRMLKKAGAVVTVVALDVEPCVQEAVSQGAFLWLKEAFKPQHLDNVFLVIAATNNSAINECVLKAANARHIFTNVVDDTAKCSFIIPSIVDRSPLVIAISSSGKAPVLARLLREKLETMIPAHVGRLATLAGEFRETLKCHITRLSQRRKFWEIAFHGRFNTLVAVGDEKGAKEELARLSLQEEGGLKEDIALQGEVALIGAGPGDPGLLTLRALQLMQEADVILYDYLVSDKIVELCRRDSTLICVGKRALDKRVSQEEINALLIEFAKKGKRVVRLKGGDPFMFGRGGEELEALKAQGVPFQVVPGITAAAGASAYAGIPLTHRKLAQTAIFITGHMNEQEDSFQWKALAQPHQTVVIYMGLMKSAYIQQQLIKHGRNPKTPVAIIENGTRCDQKVYRGTLSELAILAKGVGSPALIVLGEVVQLAQSLHWFGEEASHYHEHAPFEVHLGEGKQKNGRENSNLPQATRG